MPIKVERGGEVVASVIDRHGDLLTAELLPEDVIFFNRNLRGAEKDYARGLNPDVELKSTLRDGCRVRIDVTGTRARVTVQIGRYRAGEEMSVHAATRQVRAAKESLGIDKTVVRRTRA